MKQDETIDVGKRLKDLRRQLDISQKDFAAQLDISSSYLSEIESGKTKPGYNFLRLIAKTFRINPSWILLEEGDIFLDNEDGPNISEKDFGDATDRVKELLYYMKKSPLVQSTVLGFFIKFLYDNEDIINKDIEKRKARDDANKKLEP